MSQKNEDRAYFAARDRYAEFGVDSEKALELLNTVPISLHCRQGDDIQVFERDSLNQENSGFGVSGGFPAKPRTIEELRQDLRAAYALIPGKHRVNLYAVYAENAGNPVEHNELEPSHFRGWVEWAKQENLKIDFNTTCFAHPQGDFGFTLSHPDRAVRQSWIDHVKCSRKIAASIGRELQSPCIHNLRIPDGCREIPVDRWKPREILKNALDNIFSVDYRPSQMKDALESQLFGIGGKSFVVGSHEFCLSYAMLSEKMICLDLGNFHPTESVEDKISAVLQFSHDILLHIRRGVRRERNHIVIFDNVIRSLAEEIVGSPGLDRIHIALDSFDRSMNRIGAWVLGTRAVLKALLFALLLPQDRIREAEHTGDNFRLLAIRDEAKSLPFGDIWDRHCRTCGVPPGERWIQDIDAYEKTVLAERS